MANNRDILFSYFKSVTDKQPKTIGLEKIIETIKGNTKLRSLCKQLQQIASKKEQNAFKQANFPAITVSGLFDGGHQAVNLAVHNGLIQMDFDGLKNAAQVKALLCKDKFTFVAFISPSGNGVKVFVKIDPKSHATEFQNLSEYYFKTYGLQVDEKCKDVGRLCFLSHDPDVFVNPSALLFSKVSNSNTKLTIAGTTKEDQVRIIVEKIEATNKNITDGYDNWRNISFALAEGLGEAGRDYFHRVSKPHPEYESLDTEKQYNEALRSRKQGITLKTFFDITAKHGVYYKEPVNGSTAKKVHGTEKKAPSSPENNTNNNPKASTPNKDEKNLPLLVRIENFLTMNFEFRLNVVLNRIECRKIGEEHFREANENEVSRFLEHNHFKSTPTKVAQILGSDFVPKFNPFIEYFKSLPDWSENTNPDYIDLLCKRIRVPEKDRERFNRHFKKHLVRCVACSVVEGDTNDNFNKHIFTLVSPKQSLGKSSFLRWLCPPALSEYFTENISFSDKDGQLALAANFIINLDELAVLSKYDINQVKTFVSKTQINVRPPFGRRQISIPRRCNFFASTNDIEFLMDDTGSARWLCFEVDGFDYGFWLKGNNNYIDINNVWAQAYHLYKSGEFKYKLDNAELHENEFANESFQVQSEEMQLIQAFVKKSTIESSDFLKPTAHIKLFLTTQGVNVSRLSDKKIGSALRKLGYKRAQSRVSGHPIYGYYVDFSK